MLSRRALTRGALAVPCALALAAAGESPAAAAGGRWDRTTWAPLVGRTFVLERDGVRRRAVLAAVEDLTAAPRGAAHRFSLTFRAGHDLPEGIVAIRRPGFSAVSLFVTAVDRGVVAQHRQAVINRI